MSQRLRLGSAIGALMLLLTSAVAWAQLSTAQLSGRVTDQSGAVLPGVTVTVTQTNTGFTRSDVTDGTGSYVMPNLPTGPYRLEVSLSGFRTYVQTGIVLQVASSPVINAVLAVGELEESVTVEGAAPLVDVQSAGIGEVIENERIVELPLQGRQVTDLIILAGAAVETGRPNSRSFQGGVSISVAGGLNFGVAYVLDGAMHNDVQNAGGLPLPFPDALQEFRVATSGLSAQNGMHSGASVNAVTKSGTNRFSGNVFEFIRDKRFNATNRFAAIGPDGKRKDDGLQRNQFGGTLGGPIVTGKLFFFGGYQGTVTHQTPSANIAWVPTAAMMAGDFTAFASPACNGGRQIALRGGFVNNRIDPALFSPAAVNLAQRLPSTTDPCGQITYSLPNDRNEGQAVSKIDYQLNANHSVFGRYMATFDKTPSAFSESDNILTVTNPATDNLAQSLTFGDTVVFGANTVNSLRFAFNRTAVNRFNEPFFEPHDLGAKVYSYSPHEMVLSVTGGFNISAATATKGFADNNSYQLSDDLTLVRGRHQISLGANVAYWKSAQWTNARSGGQWNFNGQATGLGLADLLMGRVAVLEHGGPGGVTMDQRYLGVYGQDAWRVTDRVTLNAGLRWEPFFGQHVLEGSIANFSLDNFHEGVKSTVFRKAPAGFLYPGDPGFPPGKSGMDRQWWNLSPRVGVAWDVTGGGRMAVRSSYGIAYDFPSGEYQFLQASSPPFGNRSRIEDPPGRMDDPYGHLGGDPHPLVIGPNTEYILFGTFGAIKPDINSPRVQSWNVTVERQIGTAWGASVSYLGSYSDRLWGLVALNPGVFLGLSPCTLNGVFYPVCTTSANLNQRRVLYLENPQEAQYVGALDLYDDVGRQDYRGLKLSLQRRAASGVSLNGNYTWSRCFGHQTTGSSNQISSGFTDPANPDADRGHCDQDRTHLASLTLGAQTPQFARPALRALASNWRVSGILTARSGNRLMVTTGVVPYTGQRFQQARVDQVSDNVYGAKTLTGYLNRDAFAQPAPGTLGNHVLNSIKGPGVWKVDMALSRLVSFGGGQSVELRVEAFNIFNTFNWGDPNTVLSSANFGRITSQAGDPRIVQFGVKYGF